MRIRYTRRALFQLDGIYDHVAGENGAAAEVIASTQSSIENLTQFPRLGRATDETDIYRIVPARLPYSIFYRLQDQEIIILRILRGVQPD
jgi:plasmid stabilization system protein ParE